MVGLGGLRDRLGRAEQVGELEQAAVERRLLAFEALYNDTAVPFHWRFTRRDLERRLLQLADLLRPAEPVPEAA